MAFNITSNVLSMLNTMANMKTAKINATKKKEEDAVFKRYKEANPNTKARNYAEALAEQTAQNTAAISGQTNEIKNITKNINTTQELALEQREDIATLLQPSAEKILEENKEKADREKNRKLPGLQKEQKAAQAVADFAEIANNIVGDEKTKAHLDRSTEWLGNVNDKISDIEEQSEVADEQLYNYAQNKLERQKRIAAWRESLGGNK